MLASMFFSRSAKFLCSALHILYVISLHMHILLYKINILFFWKLLEMLFEFSVFFCVDFVIHFVSLLTLALMNLYGLNPCLDI